MARSQRVPLTPMLGEAPDHLSSIKLNRESDPAAEHCRKHESQRPPETPPTVSSLYHIISDIATMSSKPPPKSGEYKVE